MPQQKRAPSGGRRRRPTRNTRKPRPSRRGPSRPAPRRRRQAGPPTAAQSVLGTGPFMSARRVNQNRVPRPDIVNVVCSYLDPFCPHATGAKLLDGNTQRTETYQVRAMYTITTGATGVADFMLAPDFSMNCHWNNSPATTSHILPAAFSVTDANVTINATLGRVVSAGLRWIPQTAGTAAGGSLVFTDMGVPMNIMNTTLSPPVLTGIGPETVVGDGRVEYHWTSRPNSAAARDFVAASSSAARSGYWSGVYVQYNGAVSSVGGLIEVIINLEVVAANSSVFNQTANRAPPANPVAQLAADKIRKSAPAIHEKPLSDFSSFLFDQATSVVGPMIETGLADLLALLVV